MHTPTIPGPAAVLDALAGEVAAALHVGSMAGFRDDDLLAVTSAIERLGRRVDALRVAAAGEIAQRSRSELGREGLAARKGCRSAVEMLERITLASTESLYRRIKIGTAVRARTALTGQGLPAAFPQLAAAFEAGRIGLDSAHVIVHGLTSVAPRVAASAVAAAEFELVAAATGAGAESPLPFAAAGVKIQTEVWKARLDQDGLEPAEDRALRLRGFGLGRERGGLVPVRGALVPDVAARLNTLMDAYLSPRTAPAFLSDEELAAHNLEHDPRSRDQKRHDILAGIIDMASRHPDTPMIGGDAPAVLVTVRESDLTAGDGVGFIDGAEAPVSMRVIRQYACAGGIQRLTLSDGGRIVALGTTQRVFNRQQRRAIMARDGKCAIPGCNIPALWCEIHHLEPFADNPETDTDNGILLCWFHHRTIDSCGWEFQMRNGAPWVKAPPWLDNTRTWHPTNGSRIRQLDAASPHPDPPPKPPE